MDLKLLKGYFMLVKSSARNLCHLQQLVCN